MRNLRSAVLLLPILLLALLAPRPHAAADDYDDALDALKAASKSRALGVRLRALDQLGATNDPRAIGELAKQYGSPRAPKVPMRHGIVSILARHFDRPQFVGDLKRVRAKRLEPADAWLWYRTLVIHGRHGGMADLYAHARDPELCTALRVAALEAAVTLEDEGVAKITPELLAALPEKAAERALMVQCLGAGLLATEKAVGGDDLEAAVAALIAHVGKEGAGAAEESTKIVVGRTLQTLLDSRFAYLDGAAWASHQKRPGATRDSDARRLKKVRCAKAKATGGRIAYLIDTSARSAKEVSVDLMDDLLETKSHVGTRLGLQAHAVQESIRALKADQSFVIIPYSHHGAGMPEGFGRLMVANHENKMNAFKALKALQPEGEADLHSGLERAFRAHAGGIADASAAVPADVVLGGVDTIFVFNHSVSHYDRHVEAKESRRADQPRTTVSGRMVCGTYSEPRWLFEELARWRFGRKAVILPIPFGEADEALLEKVEQVGSGFARRTGAPPEAPRKDILGEPDEAFRKGVASYKAYRKRPSLKKRTLGRTRFAETKSLHAFRALTRDYENAEKPKPEVQQTLVDICYETFRTPEAMPLFRAWRGRNALRRDAWLWHRALDAERSIDEKDAPQRAAAEAHDPFLRAAAIRALAKQLDEEMLGKIPLWLEQLRESNAEGLMRSLPIEAMATALETMSSHKDEAAYKDAALALLGEFDHKETPKRTKLTIVRNLAAALEVPPDSLDKNTWVREVRAGGSGAGMRDTHYGAPTFGGLRASGTRICYVIDMSDSMLAPLQPGERLKPQVITGQKKAKKRRVEDEINWAKIKTRFDLARALLITSLQTLRPNTHFCVIWFGSEAGTLKSTKGLVPTTPANVSKTVSELRKIKPGKAGEGKHKTGVKWGSLRGETNLHGGIYRAFNRAMGKPVKGYVYISEKLLEEGCDTMFVLSDGSPTTDDFLQIDKRDPDDKAVKDRETMESTKATPELNYPGPYGGTVNSQHIYFDIERHNLFRQVEIHCLGIGEANMGLLERLARLGLGESRKIGEEE